MGTTQIARLQHYVDSHPDILEDTLQGQGLAVPLYWAKSATRQYEVALPEHRWLMLSPGGALSAVREGDRTYVLHVVDREVKEVIEAVQVRGLARIPHLSQEPAAVAMR